MTRTVSAIYEGGVLRLSAPLPIAEHQRVSVTVSDLAPDPLDAWLDHGYMAAIDALDEDVPSLREVLRITAKISGSLTDAVRAEREARG